MASTPAAIPQLERTLSLWQVVASGVGIVIGAGIYVLIGDAADEAGAGLWISFGIAALLSAFTALSYAELAGMFPLAGAEYEYGRNAFNEFVGYLAGWMMIVAYVVAAAAVSIGFAQYLDYFVEVDVRVGAIGLLLVLTAIVISGVERSIWLSVVLAILQIGGLIIVIVAGAPSIGDRSLVEGASAAGVLSGAALVFFAFIGFDDITTLAEETHDASRTMPRALLLTLAIATLFYILVGISAVSAVGPELLAASDQPLVLVLEKDWGQRGSDIIAGIALAATINTTLLLLTASSRMIFGMARRGALPPFLATLGRRARAPWIAAIASFAVAAAFAAAGDIGFVASVTDFAVYAIFLAMNASVVALRLRAPDAPRTFVSPLSIGRVPLLPFAAVGTILVMLAYLPPQAWLFGAAALALGATAFVVSPALGRRPPTDLEGR